MSIAKWTFAGARTSVNISGTDYPFGGGWVLDIVTNNEGNAQMLLSTAYPNPGSLWQWDPPIIGLDALTEADSDSTAATLQTAVNALDSVVGSVLTPFGTAGSQSPVLLCDASVWASYQFSITLPTTDGVGGSTATDLETAQLLTTSPADGKLSAADITAVTDALVTYLLGMSTVTACTVAQNTVTPGSV
jgi:hypothetical protein